MTKRTPLEEIASIPTGAGATVAVVGGGITGLAAARALLSGSDPPRVVLIEAEPRLGGKILTRTLEGRPVEGGPDALLTRLPWATSLCKEVGLGDQLVTPSDCKPGLWHRGRLRQLPPGLALGFPASPVATLRSGLLSALGALRASADLLLPRRLPDGDTSVGSLVRYRFGRQVLERLVEPLLGGVHAGHVDDLSLRATAPHIEALARRHRSLILGLRAEAPPKASGAAKPAFVTVRGGLGRMVEAVQRSIAAADIVLGQPVHGLRADSAAGYSLDVGEATVHADAVVLALPAFAAGRLLKDVSPSAVEEVARISYSPITTVALAYPPQPGGPPSGLSGFLLPPSEQRILKSCTVVSAKWPHLAAGDGGTILRCSVGGALGQELDDDEIVTALAGELRSAIGLTQPPRASTVTRWPHALPHYTVGHLDRVARIRASLPPTLAIAGAGYGGAGIPDCIRQGTEAAAQILDALKPGTAPEA